MFDKFLKLKKTKKYPRHIAITINGNISWSKKHKRDLEIAYRTALEAIDKIIAVQVKTDIPIITFFLIPEKITTSDSFIAFVDPLVKFFEALKENKIVHKYRVKVSVLGKWYDLPYRLVEPMKNVIEATKDYDNFFLNFAVNYDGQEEIVDACKLIARKIKAEKIDTDSINRDLIKDNIYSSYFLPPDLIIVTGTKNRTGGILLWDSAHSKIFFSERLWPDFTKNDLLRGIEYYQKG